MRLIAKIVPRRGGRDARRLPDPALRQNTRFSTTVDADIPLRPVRFPVTMSFPDNTMFVFPIYDTPRART